MSIHENEIDDILLELRENGETFLAHTLCVTMAAKSVGEEIRLAKILSTFVNEISKENHIDGSVPMSFFTSIW